MNYRKFETLDVSVSLLGFGALRLPLLSDDISDVDEAEAIRMIRYAIDNGVNYIDMGFLYHGGQSEVVVGKALRDGYREKALLATKLSFWMLDRPDEMEGIISEQLKRLGTDCIDMYLLHDISGNRWERVKEWKIFDFLLKQREAGRIRYIGFSFHGDTTEYFKEVLDEYPWDFCQIQLNYVDTKLQAGLKGYEYAAAKGVPVVVMEPLKGGTLTEIPSVRVQEYWNSLGGRRSPAEWGLRWVANLPGVLTVLSGMSTMEQLSENIRVFSAEGTGAGMMFPAELDVMEKIAEEYRRLIAYPCTDFAQRPISYGRSSTW